MEKIHLHIVLADNDSDDCLFFKDALEDLYDFVKLSTVNDGVELMHWLSQQSHNLPDVLFLDLNMPRKTGFECLSEIKQNPHLNKLPVIIYSTSLSQAVVESLYEKGADHYIRKPAEFSQLKKVISKALTIASEKNISKRVKEEFIIQP